jgi:hypothetical protein
MRAMRADKRKVVKMTNPATKRNRLIKQILKANELIPEIEAGRLADSILSYEPKTPRPQQFRHKMTFGKHAGLYLDECPEDYVRWLSKVVEERQHTRAFLDAIRAARAEVLSWVDMTTLPQDCPFDCE